MEPPFIVTLAVDDASFLRLDSWRRSYFPAERNFIPAHVSLLHKLPGDALAWVESILEHATRDVPSFDVSFAALERRGTLVTIDVVSPPLEQLHAALASAFHEVLTPQDRQKFRPHVTLVNKCSVDEAKGREVSLRNLFSPWVGRAEGLLLWRYLGGPWEEVGAMRFSS